MRIPCLFLIASLSAFAGAAVSQDREHLALESPFASFVEPDFPFFTQTIDAREFGGDPEATNLTPRGIVVKLGNGVHGCFDPDLLRWSLIWKETGKGEYLTMDGMAPGSYRLPNRKAPSGQEKLPRPMGEPLFASPARPGWWVGEQPVEGDPRARGGADEGEIGLGPIAAEKGRFSGLRLVGDGVRLEYTVGSASIVERVRSNGESCERRLRIGAHEETLWLRAAPGGDDWIEAAPSDEAKVVCVEDGRLVPLDESEAGSFSAGKPEPAQRRWPETFTTTTKRAEKSEESAFVFDDLSLPVPNPWQRNVRLAGFDFFPDGSAAFCTFDGDVWMASNLAEERSDPTWNRYASGLHEPMSVCIVDGIVHVFGRNGIWRLHDTDDNGEADWYENFSNVVAQTAETREFAMDMVAAADGGFFLAKGGQVGSTRGKHNGAVVKVSADGRDYEVIATGLRQPYLGYDAETGILTSSDQQGHWKPATPIYRIEKGRYFGFQPAKLEDDAVHPAPIDPPELWIPHFINPSGASQVWMKGPAEMGPLNGSLVHIGYNRPELFRVFLHEGRRQGAVVPILSGFPSGVQEGRLHPVDGRLYLTGFEIWGTSGARISGLFRVRPTGNPSWLPRRVEASKRGVLLAFGRELSPELASQLGRYSVDRWNYRQTHRYGSGNFELDGEPGQESVPVASAKLSADRKTLFLGLPDMRPSDSLRLTYRIPHPDTDRVESAYLTVRGLSRRDLEAEGFESDAVDLAVDPSMTQAGETVEPSVDLGREVAIRYGCVACHATGDEAVPDVGVPSAATPAVAGASPSSSAAGGASSELAVGPPWAGLWRSRRTFTDGSFIKKVDETYLRESILDPGRRVAEGFQTETTGVGMPSYLGVLKDHEIESIILYIKSLADSEAP